MSFLADKQKKKIFIIVASIVLIIAILIGMCAMYLGDYYKADSESIDAFLPQDSTCKKEPG